MAIARPFPIYPKQASVDRTQSNQRLTLPAPTGGWNTRDAPTNMQLNEAVELINMVPRQGFVEMRGGYESHSTGVGAGNVDLCTQFFDGSTRALITASPTNIYDSTAAGAATSLGTGFTNGRWDTAMMNGIMGFVNGADAPQTYDGSTLSGMTISGSGLTTTNIIGVHVHKFRSFFWEDGSQSFWYSAINALGGALTEFALGEVAVKGGKLLQVTTWTVDGGSGPDDYIIFIMSSGEVIVYQGSDPGSALNWGLVGIYDIGVPIDERAVIRYGREIMVVTDNDIISLPSAFSNPSPPVSKLSGAITDAAFNFGGNPGWELFWYPNETLMMLNVPVATSPDSFEQYVLNTETGAPSRFTGIPARTWGLYAGNPYFGGSDGTVYRFNSVANDDGSDIDVTAMYSWQDYGTPANKMITAIRPWFKTGGAMDVDIRAGYDFDEPTVSSPSSTISGGTPWGSAWGSSWGSVAGSSVIKTWRMASGRGAPATVRMRFSRQGDQPRWLKNDILIRGEGNL